MNDFDGGNRVLLFSRNTSTSCASIGITDDTLVESSEQFFATLLLESNQTFTELGSSLATVMIIDNDGGKLSA